MKHNLLIIPADYARMGIDPGVDGQYFQSLGYGWSFNTIEVIV
jgi:hypothetical protein